MLLSPIKSQVLYQVKKTVKLSVISEKMSFLNSSRMSFFHKCLFSYKKTIRSLIKKRLYFFYPFSSHNFFSIVYSPTPHGDNDVIQGFSMLSETIFYST